MRCLIFLALLIAMPAFGQVNIGWYNSDGTVSGGFVGYNDATPDSTITGLYYADASAFIPSVTATVTGVVRYCHFSSVTDVSANSMNFGIYSADGLSVLVDGSLGNPVSNGGNWYTIQLDSDYVVTAGTDYILAIGQSTQLSVTLNRIDVGGVGASFRQVSAGTVGDTMPAPMDGADGTSNNYSRFIFYCDNNAGIQ